ncbi:LytTR family DNA-binding domain-containing protein [Flavobacterium sp.]|uniref:LytTR family DNA-binding domain-containing protein n=1 Tax=Flavobacterium sp. TaxID=239 RepID=UPI00286E4EF8|nr:LytTR family DNA-binding domain-containing protein [Flavobacterium sp.]
MKNLNPSIRHHLLIGFFISVWSFIFAFFIKPFDDGSINFQMWLYISIGFSIIAFLCYGLLAIIQKYTYQKLLKWNISLEIAFLILFFVFFLIGTYSYYKSPLLNGGYDFFKFFQVIILKVALILSPIIVLVRIYSTKLIPLKNDNITIKGENKLDVLKINKLDLVCVSNSQNYVEICYIQNDKLKKKLIRTSLKKIQTNFDFLIQVHRSHLVNPAHFIAWKNQNTISLTQIEIPISKNYKQHILAL